MRFFYRHQAFLSHARTALEYQRILRKLDEEVDTPDHANVAVLHYEPPYFEELLRKMPSLHRSYRIGYCVWEADTLPDAWVRHVQSMDELWVPSAYCYAIFERVHPRVQWLPHVVNCAWRDTPQEVAAMRRMLDLADDAFVFFTITHEGTLRKNLRGLCEAFYNVSRALPNARLVVKNTPAGDGPLCVEHVGAVTYLHGVVNPAPLHALYALCDAYVSAHHAEGWGLPLSDAMLFGKPVVASNYSGNLDFMTPYNSYLVHTQEAPIEARDAYYLFAPPMHWGCVDVEDLTRCMLQVHAECGDGSVKSRVDAARQDIALYDVAHVKRRLAAIWDAVRARVTGR